MFKNREDAALKLSQKLSSYKGKSGVLVLGIPRGGVVLAKVLSRELKIPFGVTICRKIGAPGQIELAIGAVGPEESLILDEALIKRLNVSQKWLKKEIEKKRQEVKEREKMFKRGTGLSLKGKKIILVDDGIATGATIEVAIQHLKAIAAKEITLATPVAPKDTVRRLKKLADRIIVLESPPKFFAVGEFYQDFPQVTDEEVIQLLK